MSSQHKGLVFLADTARAKRLAKCLQDIDVEPILASSTDELHGIANRERIDAILLNQELPGFLSGLEIIDRFHSQLLNPITVLLADLSPAVAQRAADLKVDLIFPPNEDVQSIADAAKAALLAAVHTGVQIPYPARRLVQECETVRPMPQLIVRLSNYLDDPEASITQVARDIAADARVTAELLRVTNSASIGLRGSVTRVQDAVNYLGIRRTVALTIAAALGAVNGSLRDTLPEDVQSWHQSRSVLIASTAAAFAGHQRGLSADTAHVLGLLQEIGMLVMAEQYGNRYAQVIKRFQSIPQLHLPILEVQEFTFTHADVSAALLQKWELPATMIKLVQAHHDADLSARPESERQLLRCMQLGEAFADMRDIPSSQRHQRLVKLLQPFGGAASKACRTCFAQAVSRTAEFGELFAVSVPPADALDDLIARVQESLVLPESAADAEDHEQPEGADLEAGIPDQKTIPPTKQKPTLLVVEDEEPVVRLIRRFVATEDFDVEHARTVEAALLEADRAAVILCDVHLRQKSGDEQCGVELVRRLREQGILTPVIIVSGDRSRSTVTSAIEAGIVDYLPKPFTKAQLITKVRQHGQNSKNESAA